MTTRVDEPAPEFPDIICTPETFPASLLRTLASLPTFMLSPSTTCWAYPSDFFSLLIPNAVTTTSSRACTSSCSTIETGSFPVSFISLVSYPMNETTKVLLVGSDTLMVKFPSMSVTVPFVVFFCRIVTPGNPNPLLSKTLPTTVRLFPSSANVDMQQIPASSILAILLLVILPSSKNFVSI